MPLTPNERNLPRLHLLGTLVIVLVLTLALGAYFSWRRLQDHQAATGQLAQTLAEQQRQRLQTELSAAIAFMEVTRQRTEGLLRARLREQVDAAHTMVTAIHARESGRRPVAEVQRLIVEALRPMRFYDGRGYFFVDSMDGRFILLPTAPQLEGLLKPDNADDRGHFIMKGLIEAARQPVGEGYSRYRWYAPGERTRMADKLAYVRHFAPYDWLIGTGDYLETWDLQQQQLVLEHLRQSRFGASGSFAVLDAQQRSILTRSNTEVAGRRVDEMPPMQRTAMQRILAVADAGGGFVHYDWPDPVTGVVGPKTARVQRVQPWGWTVIATMTDDELAGDLRREMAQRAQELVWADWLLPLAFASALGLLASWGFARWSSGLFTRYARELAAKNAQLQLAASVFDHAREGIMITDPAGRIVDVNASFTRITGYARDEVQGQTPRVLNSGLQPPDYFNRMWSTLQTQGHWQGETWNRRKTGEVFAEMQTVSAVRDATGQISHYVALFTDITALKAHQQELERIAHYDALTGLPNRVLLADRLRQAMAHAQRRGSHLAVVYLDLDGFKAVNDQHGHDKGDALLRVLAGRMREHLREGDTLARLGGDEFVAVLADLGSPTDAAPLVARLLDAAARPVVLDDALPLRVGASAGVTFFPQGGDIDPDQLQRQADQAMYQAKLAGKGCYHFFDPVQDRDLRAHHETLADVERAIDHGELVLHYQPQVHLPSGRVTGVEALVRWRHPLRGLLAPGQFLPQIQGHAVSAQLDAWVLQAALRQAADWHAQGLSWTVSVNLGARLLLADDFLPRLQGWLAAHPELPAQRLELEVLETSAIEDTAQASSVLAQCRALGVGCALDDFGTGYSSLTYLQRLPVDVIKIDQTFVRGLLDGPQDAAIVRAIVGLAQVLDRRVVAEGVETLEHARALRDMGCAWIQGYAVARPLAVADLQAWHARWQPGLDWLDHAGEPPTP